jgi:hypothetical protein
MVEYSNKIASKSDIASSEYTEEGYSPLNVDIDAAADNVASSGFTAEKSKAMETASKKIKPLSVDMRRKLKLKQLFLQYVRKYITNPKKYKDHPKQIRNLPSWFDDAIALFNESEISREQKKLLREYFYGLVRYRDNSLLESKYSGEGETGYTGPDTEEMNRQLGRRSPYTTSEEDMDKVRLPREMDVGRIDVKDIARNVAESRKRVVSQPEMEDILDEPDIGGPAIIFKYSGSKNKATVGGLGMHKVPESQGLKDYIMTYGAKKVQPAPIIPQPAPVASQPAQQTAPVWKETPIRSGGMDLTKYIMGGQQKPIPASVRPRPSIFVQKVIQRAPAPAPALRRRKKSKIKVDRKTSRITLPNNIIKSTSQHNTGKMSGLQVVRNMDKLFDQVKHQSRANFGKGSMKLKVVSTIKDQCAKAFDKNKFKQESINIRKNYFNDIKSSFPQMKMDIASMGNIKESDMLSNTMGSIPNVIKPGKSVRYARVGRGSLRPEPIEIMKYDFTIGGIGQKKKKKLMDMDMEYEEV